MIGSCHRNRLYDASPIRNKGRESKTEQAGMAAGRGRREDHERDEQHTGQRCQPLVGIRHSPVRRTPRSVKATIAPRRPPDVPPTITPIAGAAASGPMTRTWTTARAIPGAKRSAWLRKLRARIA